MGALDVALDVAVVVWGDVAGVAAVVGEGGAVLEDGVVVEEGADVCPPESCARAGATAKQSAAAEAASSAPPRPRPGISSFMRSPKSPRD